MISKGGDILRDFKENNKNSLGYKILFIVFLSRCHLHVFVWQRGRQ